MGITNTIHFPAPGSSLIHPAQPHCQAALVTIPALEPSVALCCLRDLFSWHSRLFSNSLTIPLGSCTVGLIVSPCSFFHLIGLCPYCPSATYQCPAPVTPPPRQPFLMLIAADIYRALSTCEALATYDIFIVPLNTLVLPLVVH